MPQLHNNASGYVSPTSHRLSSSLTLPTSTTCVIVTPTPININSQIHQSNNNKNDRQLLHHQLVEAVGDDNLLLEDFPHNNNSSSSSIERSGENNTNDICNSNNINNNNTFPNNNDTSAAAANSYHHHHQMSNNNNCDCDTYGRCIHHSNIQLRRRRSRVLGLGLFSNEWVTGKVKCLFKCIYKLQKLLYNNKVPTLSSLFLSTTSYLTLSHFTLHSIKSMSGMLYKRIERVEKKK